jgi:CelD/BcsL family acetyltransferase involved in cellulose biosynthesis
MDSLHISAWSLDEFAGGRSRWQELLETSRADPFFMSWDWQWHWWNAHAQLLGATLRLLAVQTREGRLVGLAPFYSHCVRHRGIRLRRVELIGSAWRRDDTVFSEYLDLIALEEYADAVLACTARWLAEHDDWSDLALTYLKPDSLALRLARAHLPKHALVREIEPVQSQGIRLESGFEPYLRQLKSGARRKLSNQRQKLASPELTVARAGEVEPTVRLMLQLALPRWGVKSDAFKAFHVALARDLDRLDRLQLSVLSTAGKAISVMYIVRIRGRDYYLQSGFDVAAAQGISPGYLHMGYVIESACAAGVGYFDLLAGNGRHRDYKQDLATDQETLVCCHAMRPLWLRALYRLKTVRHLLAGLSVGGRESPKKQ